MRAAPSPAPETVAAILGLATWPHLVLALAALNLAAFAAFGIDKARARNGQWRVQESTLLGLAFLGGTIGAWAGRRAFRHKTRKQPFNSQLFAISLLQVVAAGALIGWHLAGPRLQG